MMLHCILLTFDMDGAVDRELCDGTRRLQHVPSHLAVSQPLEQGQGDTLRALFEAAAIMLTRCCCVCSCHVTQAGVPKTHEGHVIKFVTVGGRTSAVVEAVQGRGTSASAASKRKAASSKKKRSSADDSDDDSGSDDQDDDEPKKPALKVAKTVVPIATAAPMKAKVKHESRVKLEDTAAAVVDGAVLRATRTKAEVIVDTTAVAAASPVKRRAGIARSKTEPVGSLRKSPRTAAK